MSAKISFQSNLEFTAASSTTARKSCFPLGGIFCAQRSFSLFLSSQAELVEETKKNCAVRGKFRLVENSLKEQLELKDCAVK